MLQGINIALYYSILERYKTLQGITIALYYTTLLQNAT